MLPSRLFRNTGLPPALRSLITPGASLPPTVAVQLRLRLGVLPGTVSPYSTSAGGTGTGTSSSSGSTESQSGSKPPSSEKPKPRSSEPKPPTSKTSSPPPPPPPSTSTRTPQTSSQAPAITSSPSHSLPEALEPKLSMTFTCTVKDCGERSTHQFTKRAYETGIVLVQCPGCKNRHLMADHLGWFKDSTKGGKLRTVEDILREKGETVRRGRMDAGGVVEYADA